MDTAGTTAGRTGPLSAVLTVVRQVLRCEVVTLNRIRPEDVTVVRVEGDLPGMVPGLSASSEHSPCHRMLAGAAPSSADLQRDADYRDLPLVLDLDLSSYVSFPVRDREGSVVATMCGFDRRPLQVSPRDLSVAEGLAEALGQWLADDPGLADLVLLRDESGYRVPGLPRGGGGEVLAVLSEGSLPPPREEAARLTTVVARLEDLLDAHTAVHRDLGALAERHGTTPLAALRRLQED